MTDDMKFKTLVAMVESLSISLIKYITLDKINEV